MPYNYVEDYGMEYGTASLLGLRAWVVPCCDTVILINLVLVGLHDEWTIQNVQYEKYCG